MKRRRDIEHRGRLVEIPSSFLRAHLSGMRHMDFFLFYILAFLVLPLSPRSKAIQQRLHRRHTITTPLPQLYGGNFNKEMSIILLLNLEFREWVVDLC